MPLQKVSSHRCRLSLSGLEGPCWASGSAALPLDWPLCSRGASSACHVSALLYSRAWSPSVWCSVAHISTWCIIGVLIPFMLCWAKLHWL